MLVFHGTADRLVPVQQACWLWSALRRVADPGRSDCSTDPVICPNPAGLRHRDTDRCQPSPGTVG